MTYKSWLLEQKDRDDPVGDLARDAEQDEDCPNALHEIRYYLYHCFGVCDGAKRAFEESLIEYRKSKKDFPVIKY